MGLQPRSTRSSQREALRALEAPGSATPANSSQSQPSTNRRGRGQRGQARAPARPEPESEEGSSDEAPTPTPSTSRARPAPKSKPKMKSEMKSFIVEDDDESEDEFVTTVGKNTTKKGRGFSAADDSDSKETLMRNAVVYLLSRANKLTAITRAEIVRDVMGKQNRNKFKDVFGEVQKVMKETFLLKVVGLEDEKSIGSTSDSFLLLSMVPAEIYGTEDEEEVDKAMSFLNIVLTMIYMGGGPLDADKLWAAMLKLEFHEELCAERENFEKFLKNEYVMKHYLNMKEYTQTKEGGQKSTYDWGLRAHHEFSKMTMLRTVAKRMGVRDVKSFTYAYAEAKKQMVIYGTMCRGAYRDRENESTYSTTTDEGGNSRGGSQDRSQEISQRDISQEETQELEF